MVNVHITLRVREDEANIYGLGCACIIFSSWEIFNVMLLQAHRSLTLERRLLSNATANIQIFFYFIDRRSFPFTDCTRTAVPYFFSFHVNDKSRQRILLTVFFRQSFNEEKCSLFLFLSYLLTHLFSVNKFVFVAFFKEQM